MRAYTLVSGIVFALLVIAHVARLALEGTHVLKDPFFAGSTLISLALSVWSVRLLLDNRSQPPSD